MSINDIIKEKNLTKYRLSKISGIPYATLSDICSGKTNMLNCSAGTVYLIAKALEVSIEELLEPYTEKRPSFELFKSNVCHRLKELGDIDYLIELLENDDIRKYYKKKWYPECFYLLAMLDYLSRINNIPVCENYNDLRTRKLNSIFYPSGILTLYATKHSEEVKESAIREAIPEFMKYNIVESEIRNVN